MGRLRFTEDRRRFCSRQIDTYWFELHKSSARVRHNSIPYFLASTDMSQKTNKETSGWERLKGEEARHR